MFVEGTEDVNCKAPLVLLLSVGNALALQHEEAQGSSWSQYDLVDTVVVLGL